MAICCEGVFKRYKGVLRRARERGMAGETSKGLDAFGLTVLAISNQCMNVSIGDSEVRALLIGTGEAVGVYPLRCSQAAFHLTPGTYWHRGRSHA